MQRVLYYATTLGLAAAIAACGSPNQLGSPVSPEPAQFVTSRATVPAKGGAFSATYAGTDTFKACEQDGNGTFHFSGTGSGSFINAGTETGYISDRYGIPNCKEWSGQATLASTKHPTNTITVSVSGSGFIGRPPCWTNLKPVPCSFTVLSGTGKFAHATGSGTVKFALGGSNTYSDSWSGTINY